MEIKDVLADLDDFLKEQEPRLQSFLKKLKLAYENLWENHPQKKNLKLCIDYTENGEKSGITMDEFNSAIKALEKAWLVKDNSGEELWREINEIPWKVINITK